MRRTPLIVITCALACAVLAAPAVAKNTQELGRPSGEFPFPPPDCPENCQAVAQVTGFQVQLGEAHNPFRIRRPGYVTSFTIKLAKPDDEQIAYFKQTYGEKPTVRLAIVRSLHKDKQYKLMKQTQAFDLEQYFGSTPTIALRQPFRVKKEDIIAITVPTWMPAFAHNLSSDQAWRSSHSGDECVATLPPTAAHEEEGTKMTYGCFYRTARLLYSATFIGDPKPTNVTGTR
ncbi:MAG TPA: hypothetical protein VJT75_19625 [Thermoleophilaceae bacterium]|nr:hypothetical protein [Thermoleophilaceae bacterium]